MNEEREAKQIIVMRTDLNMRKGKMIAQGAHASIAWLTKFMHKTNGHNLLTQDTGYAIYLKPAQEAWVKGKFTKICVRVDSEEELLEIGVQAMNAGLNVNIIKDAGLTEFNGVPTNTCLAIGPDWAEDIDKVTGGLKLL